MTPYSKLDTAAAVAAQQLADMGQELDGNSGSLLGSSCSSIAGDAKVRAPSSVNSPGSSECGAGKHGSSSATSPANSLSIDDAAALAKLTASMAALGSPAAPLLDVGGMARLQNSAYLAAAAAAVDASLSGDISLSGSGLWPLAGSGVLQQPASQPQLPGAAMAYSSPYLQQPVPLLEPQLLGSSGLGGTTAAASGDVWLMPQSTAGQWQSVSAAAAARSMLAQQQQQQQQAFNLTAAPPAAAGLAPGIPVPNLLGPAALDQWLQLDGLQVKDTGCYPMQAGMCSTPAVGCSMAQPQQAAASGSQVQVMQQYLVNQQVRQLLGLLDAQAAH